MRTPDKSRHREASPQPDLDWTAFCIGDKRGFISHAEARERVLLNTLRFHWKKLPNHRGFYYHWANINTGERLWDSEISSIDTAILLCGILTCREYFQNAEISGLAFDIYNRVDWGWLSEDTLILPHGWTPESGFLQYRWDDYSEMMMMYLLGLGSATHPLPAESWDAWKRTKFEYDGIRYIGSYAPLFVHQYSQAWFDFRGKHDKYTDYFHNSAVATDVHRRFCIDLAGEFPDYEATICGASYRVGFWFAGTWCGAVPPSDRGVRLTGPSCRAPPEVLCLFCKTRPCACCARSKIATETAPGAATVLWTRSTL